MIKPVNRGLILYVIICCTFLRTVSLASKFDDCKEDLAQITIDFRQPTQDWLRPYQEVAGNWSQHLGKTVTAKFEYPDSTKSVTQKVTNLERLETEDESLAREVRAVLQAYENHQKQLDPAFESHPGINPDVEKVLRGEAGIIKFRTNQGEFSTNPIFTNYSRDLDVTCNKIDGVGFGLTPEDLFKVLEDPNGDINFKTLRQNRPMEILVVHTHPGSGAPLNDFDQATSRAFLQSFRSRYLHLNFTLRCAAVPVDDKGQIVFVQEFGD